MSTSSPRRLTPDEHRLWHFIISDHHVQRLPHQPAADVRFAPRPQAILAPVLTRPTAHAAAAQTLDLHEHTSKHAFEALSGFIHQAHHAQYKKVIVITGKGQILRHQVPRWLSYGSFNHLVKKYHPAPLHIGGDGALVVLLQYT